MKNIIYIFLFISFLTKANTINVCPSCRVKTIKKAIDLANSGDSITVQKGVYKENNLIITKSIHLIGINNPIIDGDNKDTILKFNANNFSSCAL